MYRKSPAGAPLVVLTLGHRIVAVERRTGRRAWQYEHHTSAVRFIRLSIVDEVVIAAGAQEIVCLEYTTGLARWRATSPVGCSSLLVDGAEIFVGALGEAAAFDLGTGALLWHDGFRGFGVAGVAVGVPGNVAQVDQRD